jgi:hypothetical protein
MKKILTPIISLLVLHSLFANDLPIIEYQSINHPVIDDDGMVVSREKLLVKWARKS